MEQPLPPRFYLTTRQPIRPHVMVLAIVAAVGALCSFDYAMEHAKRARLAKDNGSPSAAGSAADDDKDDPNQVDTIVLGDPADAPTPARKGDRVSPVHATILVRLPRFGDQVGLIPESAAGHLLWTWLAAFNQSSGRDLAAVLPTDGGAAVVAAQLEVRRRTGGFNLLSAREVQPGVMVFRLMDQTKDSGEVLGSLVVQPDTVPAVVGSFSLRAVQ